MKILLCIYIERFQARGNSPVDTISTFDFVSNSKNANIVTYN